MSVRRASVERRHVRRGTNDERWKLSVPRHRRSHSALSPQQSWGAGVHRVACSPHVAGERGVAADDDIVDYAVEVDGVVVDKIQVKASSDPPNNQLVRDLYPGIIADGDALDNFNKQPRDLHKRERSASAPGQTQRNTGIKPWKIGHPQLFSRRRLCGLQR